MLVPGRCGAAGEYMISRRLPLDRVARGLKPRRRRQRVPCDPQALHPRRHPHAPRRPVQGEGGAREHRDAPSPECRDVPGGSGVEIGAVSYIDLGVGRLERHRVGDERREVFDAGPVYAQPPQAGQAAQRRKVPERLVSGEGQVSKRTHVPQRAEVRDPIGVEEQALQGGQTDERPDARDPIGDEGQPLQGGETGERREVRDPIGVEADVRQRGQTGERPEVRDQVVVGVQGLQVGEACERRKVRDPVVTEAQGGQ